MTARENYDAMLREHVGPWLRERGFKKRRNGFVPDLPKTSTGKICGAS